MRSFKIIPLDISQSYWSACLSEFVGNNGRNGKAEILYIRKQFIKYCMKCIDNAIVCSYNIMLPLFQFIYCSWIAYGVDTPVMVPA